MPDERAGKQMRGYASPACLAHEIDPEYLGLAAPDVPRSEAGVPAWRAAQRVRLQAVQAALSPAVGARIEGALLSQLRGFLDACPACAGRRILTVCWPETAGSGLPAFLTALHDAGEVIALPEAAPSSPRAFQLWAPPGTGAAPDAPATIAPDSGGQPAPLVPDVAIVRLWGWDDAGYGLDDGNSAFQQWMAAIRPRPFLIGIALQAARLGTLHPLPGEMALDAIITEAGFQAGLQAGGFRTG